MFCIAFIALLAPSVPGASAVEPIRGVGVRNGMLEGARQPLSVITDDGKSLFVNEGKIARYNLDDYRTVGAEDVFYTLIAGKPRSFTTSQSAHYKRGSDYVRVAYRTRSLVAAPSSGQFLLAARMPNGLRLSIIFLDERGNHPNRDVDVGKRNFANILGAEKSGKSIMWYVNHARAGKPGVVEHFGFSGGKVSLLKTWSCAPGSWDDYDAKTGLLIANRSDEKLGSAVFIGRRNSYSAIRTRYPEQTDPSGYRHAFLSRGKVFAQTDRLYVRDADRKWKPFGSGFKLLASSSNDKYWLILDQNMRAWKVSF